MACSRANATDWVGFDDWNRPMALSGCAIGSGNAILGYTHRGTLKPGKKALNCVCCGLLRLQFHPFNAVFCNNMREASNVQDGSEVT